MTKVYAELIQRFDQLQTMKQPDFNGGHLYMRKDFNAEACRKLYDQINKGLIENFINSNNPLIHIITNPGINK